MSAPADLLIYKGNTNSWDESSVVWGDVQAEGEALAAVSLKSGGDWLELDVTPWIQAAAAGEERMITFTSNKSMIKKKAESLRMKRRLCLFLVGGAIGSCSRYFS